MTATIDKPSSKVTRQHIVTDTAGNPYKRRREESYSITNSKISHFGARFTPI
jgi:hypothetical protein